MSQGSTDRIDDRSSQTVDGQEAVEALTSLLRQPEGDTRIRFGKDRRTLQKLIGLFGDTGQVPLLDVMDRLWPKTKRPAASSNFRSFKDRINDRFASLDLPFRLEHPRGNRPLKTKTVWVERVLTRVEQARMHREDEDKVFRDQASELARRFEREQKQVHAGTPETEFIEPRLTTDLPLVTFPEAVHRFGEQVAPREWNALGEEDRDYLAGLSIDLQPIVQVIPIIPGEPPPVVGFECLALNAAGHRFPQIRSTCKVSPGLLGCLLAVVGLKTADALRTGTAESGIKGVGSLFFTINLDSDMVHSPYFQEFLDRYEYRLGSNFVFEVHEANSDAQALLHLKAVNGLRFALDDVDAWEHAAVLEELADRAELAKVNAGRFRTLMHRLTENPEEPIRNIRGFRLPGRPLVVEGVEHPDEIRFLRANFPKHDQEPLYAQGHGIRPNQPWRAWLADLSDFAVPGGQILASAFLASVTKAVTSVLPENWARLVSRRREGPVYWLDLPGAPFGRETMKLAVLSDRVERSSLGAALLGKLDKEADYTIVHQRDAALPGEQVTLEELADRLIALQKLPEMGAGALRMASFTDRYQEGEYQEQAIESTEESQAPAPGTEGTPEQPAPSASEGRRFLFDWLTAPDTPFCALLGDSGMGKTFLCRMLTNYVIKKRHEMPNLSVPLYLDMRDIPTWRDSRIPGIEEMIEVLCARAGFPEVPARAVLAAVRTGHVALIFDGFDEKSANMTEAEASQLFDQIRLAAPKGSKGKVLVACRTHYFTDYDHERKKVRGGAEARTREGYVPGDFRIVYLQPFDGPRIRAYLRKLFEEQADKIWRSMKQIHDLADLASRPFLLFLITRGLKVLESLAMAGGRITATAVYQSVVKQWHERDEGRDQVFGRVKEAFMQELARALWSQRRSQMHFHELYLWLQRHIAGKLPGLSLDPRELARADAEFRTATFLVRDVAGNYRFAHTSFFEFFLARHVAASLSQEDQHALDLPRLNSETIHFAVDLLHHSPFDAGKAALAVQRILETRYVPNASENALALFLTWQTQHPETAPSPCAYQLQGADLSNAGLCKVTLENVDLSVADLSYARLSEARIRGSLQAADLRGVEASDADLETCDLRDAVLDGANLAGARLAAADLRQVRGTSTFLQRADLTEARLDGAHLVRARLAWVVVTQEQLASVELIGSSGPDAPSVPPPPSAVLPSISSGHGAPVLSVAFGPRGDFIASASSDGTLKLWEAGTGRCLHTCVGHRTQVFSVAISPDGKLIASASSDKTIKLWATECLRSVATLAEHDAAVNSVAFSTDGEAIVSASSDNTLRLWETRSGRCLRTFGGHGAPVRSVGFSPGGEALVSGGDDKTLRVWDASSGRCLRTIAGHRGAIYAVAFSANGEAVLSGSKDRALKVWDAQSGRCLRTLKGHAATISAAAFSPNRQAIVSAGSDRCLKVWDAGSGACLRTLEGHEAPVWSLAFSPRGQVVASGAEDSSVKVWDTGSGRCLRTLAGREAPVWSVTFSPCGGMIACGGEGRALKVWESETERRLRACRGHEGGIRSVAFSQNGELMVSASDDASLRVWHAGSGRLVRSLDGHEGAVSSVTFSPDGRAIVSASHDRSVRLWEVQDGRCLGIFEGHGAAASCVAFTSDGKTIVSGGHDSTLRVWETESGHCLRTLKGHGSAVRSLAVGPGGGTVVSGSDDGLLKIWGAESGHCLRDLGRHCGVRSVVYSPDGRTIVSAGDDETVRVWDTDSGQCLRTLKGHKRAIETVAFSPDGATIVSGGKDMTLMLWDATSGERLASLRSWDDGEGVILTPGNLFDATPGGMARLGFVHGQCVYPAEEFGDWWHSPGLLAKLLRRDGS